jgi:hypothetical protein
MDNGEALSKMLPKSAYTQLRSNIVVETDGEAGEQGEELIVFPTTQQYALKDARYLIALSNQQSAI